MLGRNLQIAAAGAAGVEEGLDITDAFSTYLYTGNGSTQVIQNGVRLGNGVDIAPGTALGGGFFAGFISTSQDGVATHALIVAPAASGYNNKNTLIWKTTNSSSPGTSSSFDGAANTAAMDNADHPAAQYCAGLTIGGFSDWYLPARLELDIAYQLLKPSFENNNTSWGSNSYSVPKRTTNRELGFPSRTASSAFQAGGIEAFVESFHWSSTEASSIGAFAFNFGDGLQFDVVKSPAYFVRAFRKIPINDPLLDPFRVTGEGGLVWIKKRNEADPHQLQDTVRGVNKFLSTTNINGEQLFGTDALTSFNADGFSLGADTTTAQVNQGGKTYVSWTFRQAEKFFDIVTYTGDGTSNRTLSHSLGSVPGCIFLKRTDSTGSWFVYHRSTGNSSSLRLNETSAVSNNTDIWASFTPTSTEFKVSTGVINASGATYVAYLFAHDAGGFGEDSGQNVISCGSYVGNGSATAGPTVTLGWEPQWLLIKNATGAGDWVILDAQRGLTSGGIDSELVPNVSNAENAVVERVTPLPTGFQLKTASAVFNENGSTHVYIAIRRGPLKQPTDATKVFYANTVPQAEFTDSSGVPFPPDLVNTFSRNGSDRTAGFNQFVFADRLRGLGVPSNAFSASAPYLISSSTGAENAINQSFVQLKADGQNITRGPGWNSFVYGAYIFYFLRRAPSFFDVVAYNGGQTNISHNLGVVPELAFIKVRSVSGRNWIAALPGGVGGYLNTNDPINANNLFINLSSATATTFPSNGNPEVGQSGQTYIAYLFASCPGVSKVGGYTGNGGNQTINCGFTNGARFVLIKRTDTTGDWYVWDAARGIVSGSDPYLVLNTAAEEGLTTDVIDPAPSGFALSGAGIINNSGGQYIFLAIA